MASPTPTATATPSETLLLPDLLTLPSETIFIEFEGDRKIMRFETSIANVGEADLYLTGERDPEAEVDRAIQTVVTTGGEERSKVIGEFAYHPEHTHVHLQNFAEYELWGYPEEGENEPLVTQEKIGFCLFDYVPYDLTMPNAAQEKQFLYANCTEGLQGLSVGWVDTYLPRREGQSFDITDLPDGRYQIRMMANHERYIMESSYDNNESLTLIEISGNSVQVLED
jgi:hypothetical protein